MNPVFLPELLTRDALVLRPWNRQDVTQLDDAVRANLEWLRPYIPWVADEPVPLQRRRALIRDWREWFDAGLDATYGIWLDGSAVGGCGLHQRIGPGGLEIGYWVAQRVARRRVAATAVALLTLAAFDAGGVNRVEIHHARENVASEGVPRLLRYARVGEKPGPDPSGVEVVWRMTAAELDPDLLRRVAVRR